MGRAQLEQLLSNIRGLGARRLVALGLVAVLVLGAIGLGAAYLSAPEREPLYTGLSREDVGRIGGVLKDAGIDFDVSSDGTAILVRFRDTARARMLLAEKGLPQNENSGYELFNNLGSFGLTSFMQEVTRIRALEGELARTIQTMKGIRAARVHIVLPERGSFRREQQPASASVVIRTESVADASTAQAIRHLVASAIPGMTLDAVTVLNTEGSILASSDEGAGANGGKTAALEQQVNGEIEQNIRRTLTPYLGVGNFEVSVASRLNTDRTTVSETTFDPDSRVERSVRVVKETGNTQQRSRQPQTSVQQNIPQEETTAQGGNDSTEQTERREDLTNFEISSKTVQTVRDGYAIEGLSIAVLVNRDRLLAVLSAQGGDAGEGGTVDARLAEIEALVASAAGYEKARGDQLKVVAASFAVGDRDLEPVPPIGVVELLVRQAGTLINAATILVVALLLIWFGLRPAMRAILARPEDEDELPDAEVIEGPGQLEPPADGETAIAQSLPLNLIEDLTSKMHRSPQKRLEQMVEFDEEQAAAILRQWMRQDEKV